MEEENLEIGIQSIQRTRELLSGTFRCFMTAPNSNPYTIKESEGLRLIGGTLVEMSGIMKNPLLQFMGHIAIAQAADVKMQDKEGIDPMEIGVCMAHRIAHLTMAKSIDPQKGEINERALSEARETGDFGQVKKNWGTMLTQADGILEAKIGILETRIAEMSKAAEKPLALADQLGGHNRVAGLNQNSPKPPEPPQTDSPGSDIISGGM